MNEFLDDLTPEELEPRLELQVLVDPLGAIGFAETDVNCQAGSNCNIKAA
jgi:hypothetical protein